MRLKPGLEQRARPKPGRCWSPMAYDAGRWGLGRRTAMTDGDRDWTTWVYRMRRGTGFRWNREEPPGTAFGTPKGALGGTFNRLNPGLGNPLPECRPGVSAVGFANSRLNPPGPGRKVEFPPQTRPYRNSPAGPLALNPARLHPGRRIPGERPPFGGLNP